MQMLQVETSMLFLRYVLPLILKSFGMENDHLKFT